MTARLGMEEKHWVKALEAIPRMDAFLAAESARTVELLRSASELTAEGAEALRIAEAEAAGNWEYAAAEEAETEARKTAADAAVEKNGDAV